MNNMKFLILTFIIFYSFGSNVYGQQVSIDFARVDSDSGKKDNSANSTSENIKNKIDNNLKIIEGTLNNKQIEFNKGKGISNNKSFQIKLNNTNSLLYKAKFKIDDYYFQSEVPSSLTKIFPGLPTSGAYSALSVNKTNINQIIEINVIINEVRKNIKNIPDDKIKQYCEEQIKLIKQKIDQTGYSDDELISQVQQDIISFKAEFETTQAQCINVPVPTNCIDTVAKLKPVYIQLKNVETQILNGLNILKDGAANGVKFEISSDPHITSSDLSVVEVAILDRFNPKDTLFVGKTELFVKDKVKIDYSVGIAGNNLVEKEYYFVYGSDSTKNGISSEDSSPLDFSILALLHIDWKISPSFALGPNTGISISILDAKPRYHLGFSCSFGMERTFTISTGICFANMKVLSNQVSSNGSDYDNGDLYRFDSVPIANKLKAGYFFSLTYNLTRKRIKQI